MSIPGSAVTPSPKPRRGWAGIQGGIVGSLAVLAGCALAVALSGLLLRGWRGEDSDELRSDRP
jgi:hypothetical protein